MMYTSNDKAGVELAAGDRQTRLGKLQGSWHCAQALSGPKRSCSTSAPAVLAKSVHMLQAAGAALRSQHLSAGRTPYMTACHKIPTWFHCDAALLLATMLLVSSPSWCQASPTWGRTGWCTFSGA
jgi:hypothetical protein